MVTELVDFEVRAGAVDGLLVATMKQITDDRGTIREFFRRSAFESVGVALAPFQQINVTETRRGAIRGMHAEDMNKLVAIAAGVAFGAFVDLREGSPTFGAVDTVDLRPGVQVLVPAGVANGFQCVSDTSQYVYCFDQEWRPGMPGRSITPLDDHVAIPWPLPIDRDDPALMSPKDRDAGTLADLRAGGHE
jgi:dTDP-4-dehydrorhamnose 3,5-epimerase